LAGVHLRFQVGDTERHEVVFSFNKFWGTPAITVDGTDIVRTVRLGPSSW